MEAVFKGVWRPHPGQAAFLAAQAKFRVLACGRRWGKTDACAAEIAERVLRGERGKTLVVAPTLDQARLVFDRVVELLQDLGVETKKALRVKPHPRLVVGETEVSARSGHIARVLRGYEADHIVVDEAAFVADATIKEVILPMTATNPDATVTLISTPNGRGLFREWFERGEDEAASLDSGLGTGEASEVSRHPHRQASPATCPAGAGEVRTVDRQNGSGACPPSPAFGPGLPLVEGRGEDIVAPWGLLAGFPHPSASPTPSPAVAGEGSFEDVEAAGFPSPPGPLTPRTERGGEVECCPSNSLPVSRSNCGLRIANSVRRIFWSRRAPSSENPRVVPEFLELQSGLLTEAAFRREYEAEFTDAEGQAFPGDALDACAELPGVSEGPITVGVDWGRSIDATAVVVLRGTAERSEVIEVRQWHGLPFLQQSRELARVLKRYRGAQVWLDETGIGRAPTELVGDPGSPLKIPGVRMKGVGFNKSSKRRLVHRLSVQLEDHRLRLSGGPELTDQLAAYTQSTSPTGHIQYGARSGHDDLVCALMLAAAHLPAATSRILPQTVGLHIPSFGTR